MSEKIEISENVGLERWRNCSSRRAFNLLFNGQIGLDTYRPGTQQIFGCDCHEVLRNMSYEKRIVYRAGGGLWFAARLDEGKDTDDDVKRALDNYCTHCPYFRQLSR